MYPIKQSATITVPFFAHDAAGSAVIGIADGSFTKRISKNGAAFNAMTVTMTELENGWYSIPLSILHSDTLGVLSITFTSGAAKQVNLQFRVESKLNEDLNDIDVDAIWSKPLIELIDTTTIGGYIAKKLISVAKFLALK